MTAVGTVANQIGLRDIGDSRAVLMAMVGGKTRHAYAADAANVDIETMGDALYHASGLFVDGSIKGNTGRSRDNLTHVLWLPFDVDLLDFMGCPPVSSDDDEDKQRRKDLLDELGSASQSEIDTFIAGLRTDVEATFAALNLPIHRLDYTGYGLCAYIYLDERDQTRVDDAQDAHKFLIKRINEHYGDRLVDPACSDAGTRVTRIPESHNLKGSIPRLVQSLIPYTGETAPLGHNPAAPRSVARMIPTSGDGLSEQDAKAFVDAIAPSWSRGQRHAVALAVAGMLAKAGVPEEQAVAIIQALSHTDGDVWTQTITEVQTTYRRARQGSQIVGFTQLRDIIPVAALQFIDAMLERYRPSSSVAAGSVSIGMFDVVGSAPAKDRLDTMPMGITPVPDVCYTGWLKTYVDLVEPLCEAPAVFHLVSGMVLVGATMGRAVCARYVSKNVYGNTYMMLVGAAGTSRKDTAIEMALDMPNHRGPGASSLMINTPPYKQVTDVGSAEGLINVLSKSPNALLYITEYQRLVRNAKRQSTSTIFPLLTAAWNAPRVLENVTKGNPLEARFPYLSIIAAVQPGILAQEMMQEDIESGFATRWLYIPGSGKAHGLPDPPEIDEHLAWRMYRDLITIRKSYESRDGETRLVMNARGRERWIEWYGADRGRRVDNEDEASMRSRLGVHIRKIALIYAAADGANEIDLRHIEPAIAFVEWCWSNTQALMKTWGVSIWNQIEQRIEHVLRDHGAIMRKDLAYRCRNRRWGAREFDQVINSMARNGTIQQSPTGIVSWAE